MHRIDIPHDFDVHSWAYAPDLLGDLLAFIAEIRHPESDSFELPHVGQSGMAVLIELVTPDVNRLQIRMGAQFPHTAP